MQLQRTSSDLSNRTDMRLSSFHANADIFNIAMIYQVLITKDNVLRCIYRASRPSQGTVNGGAVSKRPRCRWDVKHNQPTNQLTNDNKCLR